MDKEERARRNQKLVEDFPFGVVGWAPEEVKAMASARGDQITLEEATAILTAHERLLKGSMESAGRDYIHSLLDQKYPKG